MLTRKALNETLSGLHRELSRIGLSPERMILFGSYAKGGLHANSDIDVAIWHKNFSGDILTDLEQIRPILRKYPNLDLKTYPSTANADNFDPFIRIVEMTGICLFEANSHTITQV